MVAVAGACREEKERAPGKRRKEEGASHGAAGVLQGILLVTRKQEVEAGGGVGVSWELHAGAPLSQ
jgi:hypothetical protein